MNSIKKGLVTLIECPTYEAMEVKKAVNASLEPLGGIGNFVKPGQKVALKPNLLKATDPQEAVITHPSILRAVAEIVAEAGGSPFIIDSPGAGLPYTSNSLRRIYKRCGYTNLGPAIELNFDCRFREVSCPEGRILKRFEIIAPILEADVVINLPKVKTHSFTYITCGVKNLFGVVPGLHKPAYHGRFQDPEEFALMLIDLCKLIRPCLTICDGIVGMEGDGPSWGSNKLLGLIAASSDPFALDMVISYLIGFNPVEIPCLRLAMEEGICPENVHDIDLATNRRIEDLRVQFKPPGSFFIKGFSRRLKQIILLGILCYTCNRLLSLKPIINKRLCKGCGICAKACPKGAIKLAGNKAWINKSKCIHCYCCHELCPHNSVSLSRPLFNRIFHRFLRSKRRGLSINGGNPYNL